MVIVMRLQLSSPIRRLAHYGLLNRQLQIDYGQFTVTCIQVSRRWHVNQIGFGRLAIRIVQRVIYKVVGARVSDIGDIRRCARVYVQIRLEMIGVDFLAQIYIYK